MEEQYETKTFDQVLLEAVDEVLAAIGTSIRGIVYLQLKSRGISREQIPNRLDDFSNALQAILGVGARHIEVQLIKLVQAKTGVTCPFPIQSSRLSECVVFIKHEYIKG
jgi:hypothetical protein